MATFECLNNDHHAAAFWACLFLLVGVGTVIVIGLKINDRVHIKQSPDHLDPVATNAVREEACVADTVKAGGYQSGEIDYDGGISKCGDAMLRTMLYEAAQSTLTHSKKWSWLKAWAMRVAQRRGLRRATVALARRIAVILHGMWIDGTDFRFSNSAAEAA